MDFPEMSEAELNRLVAERRGHPGLPLDYCGSVVATRLLEEDLAKAGHKRLSMANRKRKREVVLAWLRFDDARNVAGQRAAADEVIYDG